MELVLLRQGQAVHRSAIPETGLSIGRREDNGLVLSEDSISRQHAQLFLFEGRLWVRDLGSSNGTFVNGVRLQGATPVSDRDRLRLGRVLEARLHGAPGPVDEDANTLSHVIIEDVWSMVRHALGPGAYVVDREGNVASAGEAAPNLRIDPDGACTVHRAQGWEELAVDGEAVIAGRSLRRIAPRSGQIATVGAADDRGFSYVLACDLDGPGGPTCWAGTAAGELERVCGGNGAVLLYQLGAALQRDREALMSEAQVGWCDDDVLGRGVWGRGWASHDPNGLHVLIYRVRKAIGRVGLDPACVEKERGMTRIHIQTIREGRP